MPRIGLAISLAAALAAPSLASNDWAQWRGPARDGHAPHFQAPTTWPESPESVWRVEVGGGQASPLVVGDRVVLFHRVGNEERTTAFDLATGRELWSEGERVRFRPGMGGGRYGAGPKSTPVASDGLVVSYGVKNLLTARDLETGALVWRRDLHDTRPDPTLYWGNSMSPIVVDGKVVVQYGNSSNGGILAFDLGNGKGLWSLDGFGSSYASPLFAELDGVPQIVLMTWDGALGLSLEGQVLWTIDEPMAFSRQNTPTPVLVQNLLVFGSEDRPLRASRIERQGESWSATSAWQRPDLELDMASPVAFDGRICLVTTRMRGQLVCVDQATGQDLFVGEPRTGDFAVLLVTPEHLLQATPEGELAVLDRKSPELEVLARSEVSDSELWSHPAVLDTDLVIKGKEHLERLRFAP